MNCPACKKRTGVEVVDSRFDRETQRVRRRRRCTSCAHRWTTWEVTAETIEAIDVARATFKRIRSSVEEFEMTG